MDRNTMKVEIEGVGVFTVPKQIADLLMDENKRASDAISLAERAIAEADRLRKELKAIKGEVLPPHPVQPLYVDRMDVIRFRPNKIVQFLAKTSKFDENALELIGFPHEDRIQFAQLTGWSLSGFGDLSYVTEDDYARAEQALLELYGVDGEEDHVEAD